MPFLQHNNRHDCWIFQSADVWTVHSSASLETFNNPYARLGVARDETRRVSCFARKRTERENDIVSLKYSSLRFFWINLFTRLFAFFPSPPFFFCFFCSLSATLVSPCLSAHTGNIKTLSKVQCERGWENMRGSEGRAGPGMLCG